MLNDVYTDCNGVKDPSVCATTYGIDNCSKPFVNGTGTVRDNCPAMCLRCPIPTDLAVMLGVVAALAGLIVIYLAYKKKFLWHLATVETLTKCWKERESEVWGKVLPWTRLFTFLYTSCVLINGASHKGGWSFRYFTIWNYTTLILVFFLLTLHSWFGDRLPKLVTNITWALFKVELANAVGLDLVFWILLYAPIGGPVDFQMVNVHFINSVLLGVEFSLNSIELVFAHVIFVTMYGVVYCIFSWILYSDFGYLLPYPFMNVGVKAAPFWYMAMVISFPLIFVALAAVSRCKHSQIKRRHTRMFGEEDISLITNAMANDPSVA